MQWDVQNHFRFERNGRVRSFDVAARRYNDGAWMGCIRAPSQCGSFTQTVEVPARVVAQTRELMRDTASSLARAMKAERAGLDTVGAFDIVGQSQELLETRFPKATPGWLFGLWDVVGFDLSSALAGFQAQTQRTGAALQSGDTARAAGQAALQGFATGGAEGAARAAVESFGQSTGLAALANAIGEPIREAYDAPPEGPVQSLTDAQRRRNRAIRDLLLVVDLPSHAGLTGVGGLNNANWHGGVIFHRKNGGLSGVEQMALAPMGAGIPGGVRENDTAENRRAVVERLDPRSPLIRDDGTTLVPIPQAITRNLLANRRSATDTNEGIPYPWPAQYITPASDLVALMIAAQNAGMVPPPVIAMTREPLPGTAVAAVRPIAPAVAGAALGATELLARALATIALERGSSDDEVREAARVASTVLRSVDAIAGARANDPRARAAIRAAVNSASDRTARALRMGLALVGG